MQNKIFGLTFSTKTIFVVIYEFTTILPKRIQLCGISSPTVRVHTVGLRSELELDDRRYAVWLVFCESFQKFLFLIYCVKKRYVNA